MVPHEMDDNKYRSRRSVITAIGSAAVISSAGCLNDDSDVSADPESYPDGEVTWIVPYSTGGGFDSYSRLAADLLPEYLPGDGDIVVDNITGAGGRRGANTIYRAEPNGGTLGIFNIPGMIVSQFLMESEYDLEEVTWIGTFNQTKYGILVAADSEYETLADLQDADEVSWGMTGPSATSSMVTYIAAEELGISSNFVQGYEGGEEARAGILRGEVDARMNDYPAAQPLVEDGEMRYISVLDTEPPEWASDVPTVVDEGYDNLANLSLNFTPGAPPDMDEELVDVISDAFLEAMESDEAQEWADENDRPIDPLGPDETAEMVESSIGLVDQYQDVLEEHVE